MTEVNSTPTITVSEDPVVETAAIAFAEVSVSDPAVEDATCSTTPMLDVVKQHLDAETWAYNVDVQEENHRTVITAGAKGENGSYRVLMDVKEARSLLLIFIKSHINFPENNRENLAVYLTRANYGLALGNFELDMEDGEVRYKCTTTVTGGSLSVEMVNAMLQNSLVTMDRYFGNMVKVGYGVMSAKQAIQEVEGGGSTDADKVSPTQ
mmetsp:Transcript_5989/g.10005  ORF Transcript_5989/g.10005 Transcript_5989/m.10005 type:complete len:209 (+) Transcript_5989:159-785(+)|eukprot:CAMPEP_0119015196 /NCGR_PEP_ID=MMETSP1176-20130426/10607_1 /TAXON_ID=265551 /ORGANISM="Synedropsis recta cf, Strain CCMP1620" /LENGTH=208 /DNA_ID=CAMNT_0006968467 /DNA_START=136 /DNA_END=762 /DNA_ORIENTATION=+